MASCTGPDRNVCAHACIPQMAWASNLSWTSVAGRTLHLGNYQSCQTLAAELPISFHADAFQCISTCFSLRCVCVCVCVDVASCCACVSRILLKARLSHLGMLWYPAKHNTLVNNLAGANMVANGKFNFNKNNNVVKHEYMLKSLQLK